MQHNFIAWLYLESYVSTKSIRYLVKISKPNKCIFNVHVHTNLLISNISFIPFLFDIKYFLMPFLDFSSHPFHILRRNKKRNFSAFFYYLKLINSADLYNYVILWQFYIKHEKIRRWYVILKMFFQVITKQLYFATLP